MPLYQLLFIIIFSIFTFVYINNKKCLSINQICFFGIFRENLFHYYPRDFRGTWRIGNKLVCILGLEWKGDLRDYSSSLKKEWYLCTVITATDLRKSFFLWKMSFCKRQHTVERFWEQVTHLCALFLICYKDKDFREGKMQKVPFIPFFQSKKTRRKVKDSH